MWGAATCTTTARKLSDFTSGERSSLSTLSERVCVTPFLSGSFSRPRRLNVSDSADSGFLSRLPRPTVGCRGRNRQDEAAAFVCPRANFRGHKDLRTLTLVEPAG